MQPLIIFRALPRLAAVALTGLCAASGAIVYTFSGTTGSPPGTPSQQQGFRFTSPGFINALTSFPQSALSDCSGCSYVTFQPKVTNGVFGDSLSISGNSANYFYQFPPGSFQALGTHATIDHWANAGTLTVEATTGLSIANAASFGASSIASDEIVTVFSTNSLTDGALQDGDNPPGSLGGVTASVRDGLGVTRPAQLLYVSRYQLNIVTPAGMAPGPGVLSVTSSAGAVETLEVAIARVAPGIFSMNADGQGVPAAQIVRVLGDGSQVIESVTARSTVSGQWTSSPIRMGSDALYLVLYGTGLRNRSPNSPAFLVVPGLRGNITADYAGPQPQYPGLDQVNALLPAELKNLGAVTLSFWADSQYSNAVTLLFRE